MHLYSSRCVIVIFYEKCCDARSPDTASDMSLSLRPPLLRSSPRRNTQAIGSPSDNEKTYSVFITFLAGFWHSFLIGDFCPLTQETIETVLTMAWREEGGGRLQAGLARAVRKRFGDHRL